MFNIIIDISASEILDHLLMGIRTTLIPLEPYFADLIVGMAVIAIVKRLSHKVYDFFCFEYSARERGKAHKRIDNIIDFVSDAADMMTSFKSDNQSKRK